MVILVHFHLKAFELSGISPDKIFKRVLDMALKEAKGVMEVWQVIEE